MSDWADICEMYGHNLGDDADDVFESMGMFSKRWSEDDDTQEEENLIVGYKIKEIKSFAVLEVYEDGTEEESLEWFHPEEEEEAQEFVKSLNEAIKLKEIK